jgi:glyoxylase-like metal-dependent hydrolase (beta-lactamase superfamily II)
MAAEHIRQWQIGSVQVTRIVELFGLVDAPGNLFIDGSPEAIQRHAWLAPHHATDRGELLLSFQAFLVRSQGLNIMIDTCLGRHKTYEHAIFAQVQSQFLEDLESIGVPAAAVDRVLCTHLHADHVGWNTQWVGTQWQPTFPNATYLFDRGEWTHVRAQARASAEMPHHVSESVLPVMDAGLVQLVEPCYRITDEISLVPTPGHTPGHVSVHIESAGQRAVITGDVLHHPVQFAEPGWRTHFCNDHQQAQETRRKFMRTYQGRDTLVIGSHFAEPTAGWILRDGDAWRFTSE